MAGIDMREFVTSSGSESPEEGVRRILAATRAYLGMDVAFLGEITPDRQVYRAVEGEAASFSLEEGGSREIEDTYCTRLVSGEIGNVISDAPSDERVKDLSVTKEMGIGSYVAVPVHLPDGRLYGTLCSLSHERADELRDRDISFAKVLARLIGEQVERGYMDRERLQKGVQRIRSMLEDGLVRTVFQPIVEVASGRMVGVETLSRFPDEPHQGPEAWFAEAWLVGLGFELEMAVFDRAISKLPQLPDDVYVSVNLAPASIVHPELHDHVSRWPTERLVVEITEQTRPEDDDALYAALVPLRKAGLRLAMDDAGAGYSGLTRLVRMQPDFVKLDRELITGIEADLVRQALSASAVAFAERVGVPLVAEGVETKAEFDTLASLGVRYVQGFFVGRPQDLVTLSS